MFTVQYYTFIIKKQYFVSMFIIILTNSGHVFQSGRPHEAVKHLVLLREHPEAGEHVLAHQPVHVLDIQDVADSHQQRVLPDLGPQSLRILM